MPKNHAAPALDNDKDKNKDKVTDKDKGQDRSSRVERAVFWVGSILAIVTAVMTVWDRAFAPSPAKLTIGFYESGTPSLSIVPSINTASDWTEGIPLQLKVENRGGRSASNVKVYLSYPSTIRLDAQYKKESKRAWNEPNEPMTQLALALENLNPGEPFLVPIRVRLLLPASVQRAMAGRPISDTTSVVYGYTIVADISSETAPSKRTQLTLQLGPCGVLVTRDSSVYWIGHGASGTQVLRVQSDYPCD